MSGFVFFSCAPGPALSPFVDVFWGVRGVAHYHVERVLPNGAMELMINFGPRQRVVAYGDRAADEEFRTAWLAGIQDQPLTHAAPEGSNHVAARFRAGGAHAFFDVPMDEVKNRVVELDDLIGPAAADRLWTELCEAGDDLARCRALERWLLERLGSVHPHFATVRRAVGMLRSGCDARPVATVCDHLGLSNRHLVAQFRQLVGLTPKSYSRIARFRKVIDACRGAEDIDWASMAATFGYADQSHLIREFRALANTTPEAFIGNRTPNQAHVIVA